MVVSGELAPKSCVHGAIRVRLIVAFGSASDENF
jgi:hypothetical protein